MPQSNRQIVERYLNAWTEGDEETLDEVMDDDYTFTNPPPGIDGDRQGAIEMSRLYSEAFGGLTIKLGPWVNEGERIAVRFVAKGKHTGDFMGIEPTQRRVETTGLVLATVRNGKIVSDVTEFDAFGLFTQLGSFPEIPA